MSDPLWGEPRPSRPYGGAHRDTPAARDARTPAGAGWSAGATAAPRHEPGTPGREPGRPERDSAGMGRRAAGTGPRLPGGTDSTVPGATGPRVLAPGGTDPRIPGGTDPRIPGRTDPRIPGGTDPRIPGRTDPRIPGGTDPRIPGRTDPRAPGRTGPRLPAPGGTDPRQPGGTGPRGPGGTDPRLPAPGGSPRGPAGTDPRAPGSNGPRGAGSTDPRLRDPRWGESGGNGRDAGASGARGSDPGAGAPARRMPAQPDISPAGRSPSPMRAVGGGRRGAGTRGGGTADPRRPRGAGSPRRLGPWGAFQGGLGVCLIVASTALGAIVTMVAGKIPGGPLGAFVVIGTIAAALAVRPSAGRMILPVPVLSYLLAALVSGVIYNRGTGASNTALAIGAAQWIANGFFPMALATILAIVIIVIRWFLSRRHRGGAPVPAWSVPAADPARRPPRPPVSRDALANPGYPAGSRDPGAGRDGGGGGGGGGGWNGPASPGSPGPAGSSGPAGPPGSPDYRRRGPRPGSGPYNFSNGA
ncbi:MAG: DUF6542 domain-containing protein [Streptosporangiaceae bacterium]